MHSILTRVLPIFSVAEVTPCHDAKLPWIFSVILSLALFPTNRPVVTKYFKLSPLSIHVQIIRAVFSIASNQFYLWVEAFLTLRILSVQSVPVMLLSNHVTASVLWGFGDRQILWPPPSLSVPHEAWAQTSFPYTNLSWTNHLNSFHISPTYATITLSFFYRFLCVFPPLCLKCSILRQHSDFSSSAFWTRPYFSHRLFLAI